MIIQITMPILAGLAMFLFGMKTMEIALHAWTGPKLFSLLEKATRTPVRGIIAGTGFTALLQSSSAITVMAIGLVNAGILSFPRTLGIILGTNIGTCLTTELIGISIGRIGMPLLLASAGVWIASLLAGIFVGPMTNPPPKTAHTLHARNYPITDQPFDERIHPIINNTMNKTANSAVRLWLRPVRFGSLALAGFALVLLGISAMQTVGPALEKRGLFTWFAQHGAESLLWGIAAGAVATALVHSSAAIIAMAMGLAAMNGITVELGIAIALGANVGICVTAWMASIGGTRAAVFVAWSHLLLNVGGALLFYPLISTLAHASALFSEDAAVQIARSQTIFNIICSMLALPLCYLKVWKRFEIH